MALTFLQLANSVIRRTAQSTLSDVTTATGTQAIVLDLLNECQQALWNETNWHTFYTSRSFATVAGTGSYAVASDWGRTLSLLDETSNRFLEESPVRAMDENDPNNDYTGTPTSFALQGAYYRLYPIPSGVFTLRDKYYAVPTRMTVNASVTGFPVEAENCFIQYALAGVYEYLGKLEMSDRAKSNYSEQLDLARHANGRKLDRMRVMGGRGEGNPELIPPRLPPSYGQGW